MTPLRILAVACFVLTACPGHSSNSVDGGGKDASDASILVDVASIDTLATDAPEPRDAPTSNDVAGSADAPAWFDGAGPADAGGADTATPAQSCLSTGGRIETALCCVSAEAFPNSCLVGACGCAPNFSQPVTVCACPAGSCFDPTRGCVKRVCQPGQDQTCNESPSVSAIYGRCQSDQTCSCLAPRTLNPATGKCR